MPNRYALLTVDTEALPKRAPYDHVKRLVWGVHDNGTAGVREMSAIGNEFGAKHVFFVDMCGDYLFPGEMAEVVRWLDADGQDVQLHLHPEILPKDFWVTHGMASQPHYMNEYADVARGEFLLRHFAGQIKALTGKSVQAYRAGSFRWNGQIIRALASAGIALSFNNSMRAYRLERTPFGEPTNLPFSWANGVIEVPVTERHYPAQPEKDKPERWVSLTYPESSYFRYETPRQYWWQKLLPRQLDLQVFLLHSWSLLYWDEQRHAIYQSDERLEAYRKLLSRVVQDYDVITTADFLDLVARGKIKIKRSIDVERADIAKPA